MFVELTKEAWEKLQKKLDKLGIGYETSDCTLPNDSISHVHIEFGNLTKVKAEEISKEIDTAYAEIAQQSILEAQMISEQLMKQAEEEKEINAQANDPKEHRHRKWDDRYHTLGEELMAAALGKNVEEEVEYR